MFDPRKILIVPACLFALCFGTAAQTPANDPDTLVHFGDLIDVDVLGGFEFDWRGTLDADGFLGGFDSFDEPIFGRCRSVEQISADIAKAYSKILRDPQVIVRVIDRSNRPAVRLDGAVRTPTRFRVLRPVRLRELIVMAGGLTDGASGGISIFRPQNAGCSSSSTIRAASLRDNASLTINIKISDLLSGTPEADPRILSGDLITVVRAEPIYVIGAVSNPRPIYSALEMTVSRAIAAAGGPIKGADVKRVTIYRREGTDRRAIDVDLDKVSSGEAVDAVVRPFDIIEVAARGGVKRKYPPVISANENEAPRAELPLRVVD